MSHRANASPCPAYEEGDPCGRDAQHERRQPFAIYLCEEHAHEWDLLRLSTYPAALQRALTDLRAATDTLTKAQEDGTALNLALQAITGATLELVEPRAVYERFRHTLVNQEPHSVANLVLGIDRVIALASKRGAK
jgi:hypothetical protein